MNFVFLVSLFILFLATHSFVDSRALCCSEVMLPLRNSFKVKHSGHLGCHWDTRFVKWEIWISDITYKELPQTSSLAKKPKPKPKQIPVWTSLRKDGYFYLKIVSCLLGSKPLVEPQEKSCRNRKKKYPKNPKAGSQKWGKISNIHLLLVAELIFINAQSH